MPALQSSINLSPATRLSILIRWTCLCLHLFFGSMQIAVFVDECRHFVTPGDWSPAVGTKFGIQSQMDSKILFRMLAGPLGKLRKPRAGNHNAARRNETLFHRINRGEVYGMAHPCVIRMNDQRPRSRGRPCFFRRLCGLGYRNDKTQKNGTHAGSHNQRAAETLVFRRIEHNTIL